MPDGRTEAAIGIVALVAFQPVVHLAARELEHFKFLFGFRQHECVMRHFFSRAASALNRSSSGRVE
jgi:hypothetical protein